MKKKSRSSGLSLNTEAVVPEREFFFIAWYWDICSFSVY